MHEEKRKYGDTEIIKYRPQYHTRKRNGQNCPFICGEKSSGKRRQNHRTGKEKKERKEQKIETARSGKIEVRKGRPRVVDGIVLLINISSLLRFTAALPGIKTACKEHALTLLRHGGILENSG